MIQLFSQRLLIRNFKETDLDTFYYYRNDTECSKYQHWNNTSKEYLRDFIQLQQNRTLKDGDIQLAIALNDNNELIGDLYIAIKGKTITLGYTISPNHQRKGYAYEILSSLIPLLLKQYNEFEIVCLVHPDNTPSIKLLEKLNFTNEGYEAQLDSLIFSITSSSMEKAI